MRLSDFEKLQRQLEIIGSLNLQLDPKSRYWCTLSSFAMKNVGKFCFERIAKLEIHQSVIAVKRSVKIAVNEKTRRENQKIIKFSYFLTSFAALG